MNFTTRNGAFVTPSQQEMDLANLSISSHTHTHNKNRTMSYPANQALKNRYGDEYTFVRLRDGAYRIDGTLTHWRVGWSETTGEIEYVDPSGGSFITIGTKIDDQPVIQNIRAPPGGATTR